MDMKLRHIIIAAMLMSTCLACRKGNPSMPDSISALPLNTVHTQPTVINEGAVIPCAKCGSKG